MAGPSHTSMFAEMQVNQRDNLLQAIHHQDPESIPYPGASPLRAAPYDGAWAREYREGHTRWVEGLFGVEYESSSEWEGSPAVVGFPLTSLDDLSDYRFPDPYHPNRFASVRERVREIHAQGALASGTHPACLFHRAWTLLSMEVFFTEMALRPELTKQFLHQIADFQVAMAQQYVEAGIDVGMISDDWGSQHALMISPRMWREFIKRELARIVDTYKSAGRLVQVHSCGCVQSVVGDLVEIGVDILNPVQARANDHAEMKKLHGDRICFSGGVDSHTLMVGTPDDVVAETMKRIRILGPGGGYILGPDQGMPFPKENIDAMIATARQHGRYPLQL